MRIALVPFFIAAALIEFPWHEYVALALFIIASATDSLDGYVARKYDQITDFGKFIDPIADKLLVTAALLIFVERGQMASWACFIIIAREFMVSGLRLVAVEKGAVIAAALSGKIKTAASVFCISVMLLPLHDEVLFATVTVDMVCTAVILLTTVYSGVEYFVVNRAAIDNK
jgi:CDP-diacylglycerol--glycerol-3-phosphate 3-phosphatidyltransferase